MLRAELAAMEPTRAVAGVDHDATLRGHGLLSPAHEHRIANEVAAEVIRPCGEAVLSVRGA